ncbi:unnamed protein product [Ascophyllum nodosum]
MTTSFDMDAATREAVNLAVRIGSATVNLASVVAELSEELPMASTVLKTLKAIHSKVETVKSNKEKITTLKERCDYITACVIVKHKRFPSFATDIAPLEQCLLDVEQFVERYSRRRLISRFFLSRKDRKDIQSLDRRLGDVRDDMGLASNATLEACILGLSAQMITPGTRRSPPIKQAAVPKAAPMWKHWHVERAEVMTNIFERLCIEEGPQVVGVVGDSGAGKTTAVSQIVHSPKAREFFSDGILWLSVDCGAEDRLTALMMQLALKFYEDIARKVGDRLTSPEDGAAYVKRRMQGDNGGRPLRCLVVADNVWEHEVVSKLRDTGMWVLITTRDVTLVDRAPCKPVVIEGLPSDSAAMVLRRAANLQDDERLPDAAIEVMELCGFMAMDLAFVGSWSTVREREDPQAWSDALASIRSQLPKTVGSNTSPTRVEPRRTCNRQAILRAGFERLGLEEGDERVKQLYLSLAVMPDGLEFTAMDSAVLLYDRDLTDSDLAATEKVVQTLERWTILRSVNGKYRMHDAHAAFARTNLADHCHIRTSALSRWTKFISSLDTLRTRDRFELKRLWSAVECEGGDGWAKARPYEQALASMDDSDKLCRQSVEAVALFLEVQGHLEEAALQWRRLLRVEKHNLGGDHPFVVNTLKSLVECAERLGSVDEAEQWRKEEGEALDLAAVKVLSQIGSGLMGTDEDDAFSYRMLAAHVARLTPNDMLREEKLLRCALEILEDKLGREDVQMIPTLYQLGVCLWNQERYEEAAEIAKCACGLAHNKLEKNDLRLAYVLHLMGACMIKSEEADVARPLLSRALEVFQEKLEIDHLHEALALHQLGICTGEVGLPEEAEAFFRRALKIENHKLRDDDIRRGFTLYQLGSFCRQNGKLLEALTYLRPALEIQNTQLGPNSVHTAYTMRELGVCYSEIARQEEAEELLRQALGVEGARAATDYWRLVCSLHHAIKVHSMLRKYTPRDSTSGPPWPPGAVVVNVIPAHIWPSLGAYVNTRWADSTKTQSREEYGYPSQRAVQVCAFKSRMNENMDTVCVLNQLLEVVKDTQRPSLRAEQGELFLRQALNIIEDQLGQNTIQVAYTLHELGVCLASVHDGDRAEIFLRRALATKEVNLGKNAPQVTSTLHELALHLWRQGQQNEAEMLLRRALSVLREEPNVDNLRVARLLEQLGAFIRGDGRPKEAQKLLEEALELKTTILPKGDLRLASTFHELAACKWATKDNEGEKIGRLLQRALEIEEGCLDEESVRLEASWFQLAAQIRSNREEEEQNQVGAWRNRANACLLTQEHFDRVAYTLYQLGVDIKQRRRHRKKTAEELLSVELAARETAFGKDDVQVACLQQRLGVYVGKAGKNEEAIDLLKSALKIQEARLRKDDIRLADTLYELGVHALREGRHEAAMHSLRRALVIQEVALGQNDRSVSRTLYQMGVCLQRMARHDEAEALIQRSLNIKEAHVGEDSLELAFTLHEIGVLGVEVTRSDQEALLRYALRIEEAKLPNDDL